MTVNRLLSIAIFLVLGWPFANVYAASTENLEPAVDTGDNPEDDEEGEETQQTSDSEQDGASDDELEEMKTASSTNIRQFHDVLDELFAEFAYDVKAGQISGLKNLAVRKVEISDAIPATYQKYVQLLVEERIRLNSRTKLINCIPCHAKVSKIIDGKITVTSPSTNISELKLAAEKMGIENFMDVVLIYHSTHMVLAFSIFKANTSETIWAKAYNSEAIKSRYQKLAIDFSQVKKSRPTDEYVPEFRVLMGLGGASIPNVGGDASDSKMLDLLVRSSERFDNRHTEFGLELSIFVAMNALSKSYPIKTGTGTSEEETTTETDQTTEDVEAQPAPFRYALGLYAMYSHNFLGSVESYDNIRQGMHLGVGVLLAQAYMAPTAKMGWDMYFGRRFGINLSAIYVSPSQVLLKNEFVKTKGGVGGELVVSYNY